MGFKDMKDLRSVIFRRFQVPIHVSLRIDHDGFALRRRHIGSVRQTTQVELFEVHDRRLGEEFRNFSGSASPDHHTPPIKNRVSRFELAFGKENSVFSIPILTLQWKQNALLTPRRGQSAKKTKNLVPPR